MKPASCPTAGPECTRRNGGQGAEGTRGSSDGCAGAGPNSVLWRHVSSVRQAEQRSEGGCRGPLNLSAGPMAQSCGSPQVLGLRPLGSSSAFSPGGSSPQDQGGVCLNLVRPLTVTTDPKLLLCDLGLVSGVHLAMGTEVPSWRKGIHSPGSRKRSCVFSHRLHHVKRSENGAGIAERTL